MKKPTNTKAFTLIELLTSLLLIGIASIFALQGMHTLKQHADDDVLSSKLIKMLQFAKQESLLRHSDIALCFANKENQCQKSATENMIVITDSSQKIATMKLQLSDGKIFWRAYPFYRDRILFSSSGDKLNDNATYWYCHQGEHLPVWVITVARDGRIRKEIHGKLLSCTNKN